MVKPLSFTIAKLKKTKGRDNKKRPPNAKSKAINVNIVKINKRMPVLILLLLIFTNNFKISKNTINIIIPLIKIFIYYSFLK